MIAAMTEGCELTILMPCLNEAETLARSIDKAEGFLVRSGINGEVLIADNGSTDGSQEIARAHGARVVDVPLKGYGSALIAGIEAARGKYVIMSDCDDSYAFGALDAFGKLPSIRKWSVCSSMKTETEIEPHRGPQSLAEHLGWLHRLAANSVRRDRSFLKRAVRKIKRLANRY
jgi:glycosyltransferase involved in cell wall biosynthesis